MSDEVPQTDLSMWFSTYGLLTATRVLERFHIQLNNEELITAMKDPFNVYHRLLIIPLKNVFNGIILQQAHDYEVYAQKLFVDYLLSGESGKDEDTPGGGTREELEQKRLKLNELGEGFNNIELAHQQLIAESQSSLIKVTLVLQKALKAVVEKVDRILRATNIDKDASFIERAIRLSMVYYSHTNDVTSNSKFWVKIAQVLDIKLDDSLKQKLLGAVNVLNEPVQQIEALIPAYLDRTNDMGINIRSYRSQFYDIILRVMESLNLLSEYHLDLVKLEENRSTLHFDSHIGDDS